jgi:hypothetical protein
MSSVCVCPAAPVPDAVQLFLSRPAGPDPHHGYD